MNDTEREQLVSLAGSLRRAKVEEDLARKRRVGIEEQILTLLPNWEKGQKTFVPDGGVSITVKRDLSYKADLQAIDGVFTTPGRRSLIPPIKYKTERVLDTAGYEWYREQHPELFSSIAKHVEVKPKKPNVTVNIKAG